MQDMPKAWRAGYRWIAEPYAIDEKKANAYYSGLTRINKELWWQGVNAFYSDFLGKIRNLGGNDEQSSIR